MGSEYDEDGITVETQSLLANNEDGEEKGAEVAALHLDPTTPTIDTFLDRLGPSKGRGSKTRSTPLPYLQVLLVSCFRLTQPLCFSVIMPFLNYQLVHDLHVADETTVGYYSGIIETSASVSLALGVFAWSYLSDRYGRRPCLIGGGTFACLLSIAFGFARNFWTLTAVRFVLGLALAAQASTTKVMMAEMTDDSNAAQGFAFLGLGWQVGATVAPMLGGILANPATTWPSVFAGGVFDRYPYALPSVATAIVPAMGALLSFFHLEETHPQLKTGTRTLRTTSLRPNLKARDSSYPPTRVSVDSDTSFQLFSRPRSSRPFLHRIKANVAGLYANSDTDGIPGVLTCGLDFLLVLWFLLLVQIVGILVAELLLFFASPKIGGLGLSQGSMAAFLTIRPFFMVLYEVNVFPRLSKRFGNEKLFRALICIPVLTSALYLLVSHLAMTGSLDGANHPVATFFVLGISLILQTLQNPIFLCADVLVPSRAPHSSQLSVVNAWGEIIAQVGISLGALGSSSTFAYSAGLSDGNPWKGRLVWVCVLIVCGGTALLAQKLTRREGWREGEQGVQGDG